MKRVRFGGAGFVLVPVLLVASAEGQPNVVQPQENIQEHGFNLPGDILFRPIPGRLRILVLRLAYLGEEPIATHADVVRAALDMESALEQFSYGKTDVVVTVPDMVIQLQNPRACYLAPNPVATRVRTEVRERILQLTDGGVDIDTAFDREIFVFDWALSGRATAGMNFRTVLAGNTNGAGWVHEIGHTNDWRHANHWQVPAGQPPDYEGPGAEDVEYGDDFDVMGCICLGHFNAWYKWRGNWLSNADVRTIVSDQTVTIQAIEDPPDDAAALPTAIRIPRDAGRDLWVFYRKSEPSINQGVLLQWGYRRNVMPTRLLDYDTTTPGFLDDAELPCDGSVFVDSVRGFQVSCSSASPADGQVTVQVLGLDPQTQPDILPVLDIFIKDPLTGATLPDGQTLSGVVTYAATAYDPDVGRTNGAGIRDLEMFLYPASDPVHQCMVGGGPPCAALDPVACSGPLSPPYEWTFDTTQLWCDGQFQYYLDGGYILVVAVNKTTPTGKYENFAMFPHLIDNSGLAAPCLLPGQQCPNALRPSCPDE